MRAFLVPVGTGRYQLYVEVAPDASDGPKPVEAAKPSWFARQVHRFKKTLAEAEQERLRRERGEAPAATGLWRRILGKIAEAMAEQRLLWQLRGATAATLVHPSDVDGAETLRLMRAELGRDSAKHVRWLIIDAVLVAITGPLFFFVPGPNVVSWYFTFRVIAHFLSWRGAKKGLSGIAWTTEANPALASIRLALAMPEPDRRHRLNEIARALDLDHLAGFITRVSARKN